MKTSIADYDEYKNVCQKAADDLETFNSFRQNISYTAILEHVSHGLGQEYVSWIQHAPNFHPRHVEISKLNDLLGGCIKVDYNDMFTQVCPSTMRYLKVALELEQLFGSLDDMNIIEIGVGYGGQCNLINNLWNIKSYTLVDLKEPLALAKRYLGDNDKFSFKTMDELSSNSYDLVISNYAFSECNASVQQTYMDLIMKNSKHGYITYNNICHLFNIESINRHDFKNHISCNEIPEVPLSGDNCIFYW